MNKTAIKNFAIWARNKLIADIVYQAGLLGVTDKGVAQPLPQSTNEVQFFDIGTKDYMTVRGKAIRQRNAFVAAIKAKQEDADYSSAFRIVVEKVAYTWFNRLIAIRFMEVNDYLPGRVRILSSENPDKAEPDMVTRPFDTDLSFSAQEQDEIMRMKDENKLDELFRMLFIRQCHMLHEVLPGLFDFQGFEQADSYLELLLTISFTDMDGVIWHLVHDISEDDFNVEKEGQVEIIGWMYQYYNTEPKDQVFASLKKNIKISKENIPAATQLFTPDWIVRYMVENSLGRLWVEGHPNEELKKNWKYYLEEAEQEPQVQAQLAEIRKEYAALLPEEIKVIDPCMGSGHILVYLFDVLMQIYESQGWTQREAAQSIVKNNLYGLDIDDRAAQLAYFAVMMKARQYDRRFLERGITPHVYGIQESNDINREHIKLFGKGMSILEKNYAINQLNDMLVVLHDAKEYGSILNMMELDWDLLRRYTNGIDDSTQITLDTIGADATLLVVQKLVEQAQTMEQKYQVVVTNPPYMGSSGMGVRLSRYVKAYYPDTKSDLFAVFIERLREMLMQNGYQAMITQQSWMFLSSFEKLRIKLQQVDTINMVHLGARAFEEIGGEVVQTTSFVFRNCHISDYKGMYCRMIGPTTQQGKEDLFLSKQNRYIARQDNFVRIPGVPVAYWVGEVFFKAFDHQKLGESVELVEGIHTRDNETYLRLWHEIDITKSALLSFSYDKKWFPYNKGGLFRQWYGNNDYVVNWENDGRDIKAFPKASIGACTHFFKEGITFTFLTSGINSFRYSPNGFLYDMAGPNIYPYDDERLYYYLALFVSKLSPYFLNVINPTLNMPLGDVKKFPVIWDKERSIGISQTAAESIELSRADWDSFETSWNFLRHPLVRPRSERVPDLRTYGARDSDVETGKVFHARTVEQAYLVWQQETDKCFSQLKENEEELNRVFIDIYGLQDELSPEVEDKNISIRKANLGREIRSLLSYSVGCMLGRYSLDVDGLAYAGGKWNDRNYKTYLPDLDNCLPVTDESYFKDDIVGRFVEFIRTVYGDETLEENLDFIAKVLGNKGNTSREIIRNYFLYDFMKDHIKTYQKRPIYWMFDSGKQNGFKALVYMHRWNADTVGNVRVEYLHRIQRIYEKEIERMQDTIDNSRDNREVNQANKRREKLVKQLKEVSDYDSKIAHVALSRVEIDLDDGVKVNYEKVQRGPDGKSLGILAKI